MPTDTIYGLLGQALNKKTVERIYKVRRRSPAKPLIILIASLADLGLFGIKLKPAEKEFLSRYWPGALSVILPCPLAKFKYLHRGTRSLAFRWPTKLSVLEVLKVTGPLVAPSANPEEEKSADNLKEAKDYFGEEVYPVKSSFKRDGEAVFNGVDFYYGRGSLIGQPSTLVKLEGDKVEVLRPGAVKIKTAS